MFFEFLNKRFQKVVKIINSGINNYRVHIFFQNEYKGARQKKKFFTEGSPYSKRLGTAVLERVYTNNKAHF
jgi:hypothetical protein